MTGPSPRARPEEVNAILETILVPLDGSPLVERALPYAVNLAKAAGGKLALLHADLADRLGAELLLLSVVQPPAYAYVEGYAYLGLDPEVERAEAAHQLETATERLRTGDRIVKTRVELGYVVEMILQTARAEGIDLIVMATHGRGGLARFVLGSVATGMLRQAVVPILLLRPSALVHPLERAETSAVVAVTSAEPTSK
jgi:nucleotide-binding universal stress UspA family protein